MKINQKIQQTLIVALLVLLFSACNTDRSVNGFAEMGQKFPCDGLGLCTVNDNQAVDGNAIPVTFTINTGDMNKITISYSMSALKEKQANNAKYVSTAAGTYSFPAKFQLPEFVASGLGLPASSYIPAGAGTLSVSGDAVTISMPLAH